MDRLSLTSVSSIDGKTTAPIVLHPFDPDKRDVSDFINHFELVSKANNWSEQTKLYQLPILLTKIPMEWYNNFVANSNSIVSWNLLRNEFISTFSKIDQIEVAEEQLSTRKWLPDESLDNYFFDVLRLCRLIDKKMADQQKIVHITRGIPPGMKHYAISRDFDNTMEFRKYLHKLNVANNFMVDCQAKPQHTTAICYHNAIMPTPHKIHPLRPRKPYGRPAKTVVGRSRYKGAVTSTGKPICFNCQKAGHLASTCKNESFCRYCKQTEHTILSCPTRPL